MDKLISWIKMGTGLSPELQWMLFKTIFIPLALWIAHRVVGKVLAKRLSGNPKALYRAKKISTYTVGILVIIIVGRVWFRGFQDLTTYLGLLSAGLAVALRDPLVNLAGWLFIIWRRPFEVGDRIQIGEHAGDVIDVRFFQFTLMEMGNWVKADQSTGRIIHIPNAKVFTETQANYSKGFQYIWDEMPILVTFESNWEKAKEILMGIVKKHSEHLSENAEKRIRTMSSQFMIFYSNLAPTVYTSVQDSGVLLTLRFLCEPRNRRAAEQAVWEDVLRVFNQNPDIDFAYPTQRFYKLNEARESL